MDTETNQYIDGSFQHPQQMFQLIDQTIVAVQRSKLFVCTSAPMERLLRIAHKSNPKRTHSSITE